MAAVRRCRQDQKPSGETTTCETPGALLASLKSAEAAFANLMDAAGRNQSIRKADLNAGSTALITMTKHTQIQKWIEVVKRYDDRTYQHSLLVAGLVASFASNLGYSTDSLHVIAQAALLHDIAKSRVPREILNRTGPLTEAERAVIETHCALGHTFLAKQGDVRPAILDVVLHHHELLDGSGDPDRLPRAKISSVVRIVTISDIYAALIERRLYHPPMSSKAALETMHEMGPKLDSEMLMSFGQFLQAA